MKRKNILLTIVAAMLATTVSAQTPGGVSGHLAWGNDKSPIKLNTTKGFTYVGINRVRNDREQTIWSIGNGKTTAQIQTTARAANLNSSSFMNYSKDTLPELRLYSYSTSDARYADQNLYIGRTMGKNLPSVDLQNGVVEYVVYPRALSQQERSRVESYLALKYGITLLTSYLDGKGNVVWNKFTDKHFNHHIAGIINDPVSQLVHLCGYSAQNGNMLTIRAQRLNEGSSLVWGDNNLNLSFITNSMSGKWMQRRYLLNARNMESAPVEIRMNTADIQQISPLAADEHYFLAIDPSGKGSFSPRSVQYYPVSRTDADTIIFNEVTIAGNTPMMTLRAGKEMFITIGINHGGDGESLDVLITGGMKPYQNVLVRDDQQFYKATTSDSLVTISGLHEGKYTITTIDKLGNTDSHEFELTVNGIAEISTGHDGADQTAVFANVVAAPNPTTDGNVELQVEFSDQRELQATLYTLSGSRISEQHHAAKSYHKTRIYLPGAGAYLLELRSGDAVKTIKLTRK